MEDDRLEQPEAKKPSNADRIAKKKAQREALDNQIRQMENQEKERKRKKENHNKFLVGSVVLSEADKNPGYKRALYDLLGRALTRNADRESLGLPPLPDKKDDKKADS